MSERYKYPPLQIIFPYAFILFIPAAGIWGWFKINTQTGHLDFLIGAFYWGFMLALAGPVILWIWNNLSVRIEIHDAGLLYQSKLKKNTIPWNNIVDIQRSILYERHGWHDSPNTGNDLLIKLNDGKKIKIYGIVCRCDNKEGGITELETVLRNKTTTENYDPEQQKQKLYQRELRLCVVGGILCFIFAVIYLQHPMPAEKEKLGFITTIIGVSADGLSLLFGGIGLTVWAISKIRKQSR